MADNKMITPIGTRIHLVDPNDFTGGPSMNYGDANYNQFVATEDLNILVEFTSYAKTRSVLSGDGNKVMNIGKSGGVSFLDGATVNGKKVLTTSYTDLTDVTSEGDNEEAFGITNIDIEFNSSYAPLITINFVDVRGGALFQNKAKSKYAVLFTLPYPLFQLKVKGFYGKAVTYCLHLTKVNSKFNAATGNFEITANFVGHTYAMLADMLIGYLRAIPKTTEGKAKFASLGATEGIIPLDDLITKISQIEGIGKKIAATDPNAQQLSNNNGLLEKLNLINVNLDNFVKKFKDQNLATDPYIVVRTHNEDNLISGATTEYFHTVGTIISSYNEMASNNYKLSEQEINDIQKVKVNYNVSSSDTTISQRIRNIIQHIAVTNGEVIDLTIANDVIVNKKKVINDAAASLQKSVASTLGVEVKKSLGFEPTIKNIVNIFTRHIEIFIEILHDVAVKAKDSQPRTDQLSKFIETDNLDLKKRPNSKNKPEIHAWPQYNDEKHREQYLGGPGVLAKPLDVTEVNFVERFYDALLEVAKENQDLSILDAKSSPIGFGVNPLDTIALTPSLKMPYKRLPEPVNENSILSEVLTRMFIFRCVSNRHLTTKEIQEFARIEAVRVIGDIGQNNVIKGLTNSLSVNSFTKVVYTSLNGIKPFMVDDVFSTTALGTGFGGAYVTNTEKAYRLNRTDAGFQYLPVASGFDSEVASGSVTDALSNYIYTKTTKSDDKTIYLKFITPTEYDKAGEDHTLPEAIATPSKINYLKLTKDIISETSDGEFEALGVNPFNGKYGVQEFRQMDWGNSELEQLPLRFVFYSTGYLEDTSVGFNFLSEPRVGTTPFDTIRDKIKVPKRLYGRNISLQVFGNKHVDNGANGKNLDFPNAGQNWKLLATKEEKDISFPFINFTVQVTQSADVNTYSLFGSRFYYEQPTTQAKAFLFLHCLPWKGLTDNGDDTIFSMNEIINLFANRAGFIEVPKLWGAFIGSLLWRSAEANDPITFKSNTECFVPLLGITDTFPTKNQYLKNARSKSPLSFSFKNYLDIDEVLLNLPEQVKTEFIKQFTDFTNDERWITIRNGLEMAVDNVDFKTKYIDVEANAVDTKSSNGDIDKMVSKSFMESTFSKLSNYSIATPCLEPEHKYNFLLELKHGTDVMKSIISLIKDNMWIANTHFSIWHQEVVASATRLPFKISETYFKTFTDAFIKEFKTIQDTTLKADGEANASVYKANQNDALKLNVYRTLKAINDKWVGGTDNSDEVIFPCGGRFSTDSERAAKRGDSKPRLIDTFRFLNRSFKDIGDEFLINPYMLRELLVGDVNQNFYGFLSQLLTNNHFDFIPLPTFINYNNASEVEEIFKPFPYAKTYAEPDTSGPSFVCMYIGQGSTKLDMNIDEYEHENDGLDYKKGVNGTPSVSKVAADYSDQKQSHEDMGVAFMVNYGQQNQNIFKDVQLDQSEFNETAEGLTIMDDISKVGAPTNNVYVGQNLYNVYSVRSYTANIEMMGNARIQPMMHFQLNNIPMFHGAYVITSVKHNIKPNYMTTSFKGPRLRRIETPIIDAAIMYADILKNFSLGAATTGSGNSKYVSNSVYKDYADYHVLPSVGLTYQVNNGKDTNAYGDDWAMQEVGKFMEALGAKWNKYVTQAAAPTNQLTPVINVGSFGAAKGNGGYYNHSPSSLHYIGLAVDFRAIATDGGKSGKITVDSPTYSSAGNVELIKQAFELIGSTEWKDKLSFNNIICYDDAMVNTFASSHPGIVIKDKDHKDHIHFEFNKPPRVVALVNSHGGGNETLVSAGEKGSPVKNTNPSPKDITQFLGQIA